MEKTLAIIKPDAVAKGHIGEIITAWERAGFKILAAKMIQFTRSQAEEFYRVHKGKPFFEKLLNFMTSGPCMALVLAGENVIEKNRKLMGSTNPALAEEGTLRKRFGTNLTMNAVHGSDSPANAEWEMYYMFSAFEILDYAHHLGVFEKLNCQDH